MILSYPTVTPTLSVTIRNPILGDSVTIPMKTNLNLSMSGLPIVTKRILSYERLLMTINTICDPTDIITFIRTVKGDDFRLNLNSVEWIGKFVTNPTELINEIRNGHQVTLEFQGERQ
jgi:hypothetical protein